MEKGVELAEINVSAEDWAEKEEEDEGTALMPFFSFLSALLFLFLSLFFSLFLLFFFFLLSFFEPLDL